jgi:hypothetical protein
MSTLQSANNNASENSLDILAAVVSSENSPKEIEETLKGIDQG